MRLMQRLKKWLLSSPPSYDTLPPEEWRAAKKVIQDNPLLRKRFIQFSLEEYDRNVYYNSVINTLSNQVIGPCQSILGLSEKENLNSIVEVQFEEWVRANKIGTVTREFRKKAALTGLALAIPYKYNNHDLHPVQTSFNVYGANDLETPWNASPSDRICNGIQYDKDWNITAFHFKQESNDLKNVTKEFRVHEVIFWSKNYLAGRLDPIPECLPAFFIYPLMRRYLEASIKGEEFRMSFPMAVEVDAGIYRPDISGEAPTGYFEYQPNTIPTLPPGTSLKGIPGSGSSSADKDKLLRTMAGACALTLSMPTNLAIGDSSNSNMASAQVDIQPWKNKVNIDRFDLEPTLRQMFKEWWSRIQYIPGIIPRSARSNFFPHQYVYDPLFNHPDPLKCANARMVDLSSGVDLLSRIYAENGQNPKRAIEKEAKLLGISYEEMCNVILSSRSAMSAQVLGLMNNAQED